jgi:AhpD family alkylhydroperoxidase
MTVCGAGETTLTPTVVSTRGGEPAPAIDAAENRPIARRCLCAGGPDSKERKNPMRPNFRLATTLLAAAALVGVLASSAAAEDPAATAAYRDITATLGFVPGFFKAFPEAGIAGAWSEFKSVQLNPATALPVKMKELIGLAVASQIPCAYCIYFHTRMARANGATDEEVREAVAMAAISRHWSTVLNGMQVDLATFKAETDQALRMAAEKAGTTAPTQ